MLSREDEDRIAAAVHAAETRTSGEIVVVLAEEVSKYREIPLAWAAAAALALPPIGLSLSLEPLIDVISDPWTLSLTPGAGLGIAIALYAGVQIVLFLAVLWIVHVPAVRRRLTPRVLKRHRVAQAAHRQFAAVAARAQGSETGVLLFVALTDHQVQVLADAGAHARCGEGPWKGAADSVAAAMKAGGDPTAGIIEAVEILGAALAEHYPSSGAHQNSFSDRPIEL
jgi:putative membrane protein